MTNAELTFTIQFFVAAKKKHIKLDRYPWRHFPGWLNMTARRVSWLDQWADRDRGEEIKWQRQQTPPGCYWFIAGARGSPSCNVCATAVGLLCGSRSCGGSKPRGCFQIFQYTGVKPWCFTPTHHTQFQSSYQTLHPFVYKHKQNHDSSYFRIVVLHIRGFTTRGLLKTFHWRVEEGVLCALGMTQRNASRSCIFAFVCGIRYPVNLEGLQTDLIELGKILL